jgi:hypothetical protein
MQIEPINGVPTLVAAYSDVASLHGRLEKAGGEYSDFQKMLNAIPYGESIQWKSISGHSEYYGTGPLYNLKKVQKFFHDCKL